MVRPSVPDCIHRLASRLRAVLRHEGIVGIQDRIRYPKPFWRRQHPPAPMRGPVLVQGGTTEDRELVARTLKEAGITLAASSLDDYCETIRITPLVDTAELISNRDILIVTAPDRPSLSQLLLLARHCRAILCDCSELMQGLQQHGIPLERIFALKNRDSLGEGLDRYLLARASSRPEDQNWRAFSDLHDLPPHPRLCLSLPETVERRRNFLAAHLGGFRIFDGVRHVPGWIGAASSFRLMAQACLEQQAVPAMLVEDDVVFDPDVESRLGVILSYLEGQKWDVFSGLLTDVGPDYMVTNVVRQGGEVFIHLNRCVGMVCGLYNRRALDRLASWTLETNLPIDRHLESSDGLEVVTTLPFLADHCDKLTSSIWRFGNRRYRNMIQNSEARLKQMLEEYETRTETAALSATVMATSKTRPKNDMDQS